MNKQSFIVAKSQEISLAVIKLAIRSHRKEFRQRLERLAFDLIEIVGGNDYAAIIEVLNSLSNMVAMGGSIYEIETINAKIVSGEISNLISLIRQSSGIYEDELNLSHLFSKPSLSESGSGNDSGNDFVEKNNVHIEDQEADKEGNLGSDIESNSGKEDNNGNGFNTTMRQSAIIEKIRQSGNAAMRDLIAEFPDVSERTLRYDLQKLCDQEVITRVGNSGPASYYTIRNKVVTDSL